VRQADWTARAIFAAVPPIKSFAVFAGGNEVCRVGMFREGEENDGGLRSDGRLSLEDCVAKESGITAGAIRDGKRAYLADLKVVSAKDVEFAYLPVNCQVRLPTLSYDRALARAGMPDESQD
jgi:hypothetical protein